MNLRAARNGFMAVIGLVALFACILACTSFSPDDKKILYPTFDPKARAMGVAVYDRASRESRILFTSKNILKRGGMIGAIEATMMRSQWLSDGKNVVITSMPQTDSGEDQTMPTFAMLSLEGKEPVRLLHWGGLKDAAWISSSPLAMVGTRAFVNGESNIITLDLLTGETRVLTNSQPLAVYPSPVPGRFGFIAQIAEDRMECGLLNPETMTKEWRVELEGKTSCDCFFAFSPVGRKVVFTPDKGGDPILTLYELGQSPKQVLVPVNETERINLGQVVFSPDGRSLYVAFEGDAGGKAGQSLGIIEIPLDGRPPKRTVLIGGATLKDDRKEALTFFQFGLSHDGKALAVSSAYVALANEHLRAEDCALFIIDLAGAKRQVTRIPIPLPVGGGALPN